MRFKSNYLLPFLEEDMVVEEPFVCQNTHNHTQQDERNTEPLSHIERHSLLEGDLLLLDELDYETGTKKSYKPPAEERSRTQLSIFAAVHHQLTMKMVR